MDETVRILEERVDRAVTRLGELRAEAERLREENRRLHGRVDALEAELTGDAQGDGQAAEWASQRARVVSEIHEAVAELRGE